MTDATSETGIDQIEVPERQYDLDEKRIWKCPWCSHEKPRHHASREPPMCDPCDWQHATYVEMHPYKDGEKVSFDD